VITVTPLVKYTLGRVGLFVGIALLMWPVPVDLLVKLMIALIASFGLQFVVLRKWRGEMINQVDRSVTERRAAKDQLRSALAGDDTEDA
jgi:predicted lysophospholipase L1 biosynthesis ABC-type transport system permease subunit